MRLENRVALVTGGSRGIGRAIVDRLQEEGASVMTCGRGERPPDLQSAVRWLQADVSRSIDCAHFVEAAQRELGPLSILVNNAGIQVERSVVDTTDEDWEALIGTNARGVFNMCRCALKEMVTTGGSIVNIGSISGLVSDPRMAVYNATKAFVHGLTRSIAVDHGPKVRCNAVCPGWIMTGMAEDAFKLAKDPAAAKTDALARHPAGRFGQPSDVARMVAWLCSEEASFVTGQCYVVDGGLISASPLQPGLF